MIYRFIISLHFNPSWLLRGFFSPHINPDMNGVDGLAQLVIIVNTIIMNKNNIFSQ